MATNNSKVKFAYVSTGNLPSSVDTDTIYFLETQQKLYVGSALIAAIQQLAKQTPAPASTGTVKPGGTLTAMTSTTVNGMDITDVNKTWTLAHGSVASGDDSFVTGGDVYTAIDAATAALTGAMHFLGFTSSAVTDGGQQAPTINSSVVPVANLKAGDVVIYQPTGDPGTEYVWDADGSSGHWRKLGDDSSFALKTTQITAGTGLTGGGTLASNVTINHYTPSGAGSSAGRTPVTGTGFEVVADVDIDSMGHVVNTDIADLETAVEGKVTAGINALDAALTTGDYIASISQTNGVISANAQTFGSVTATETRAVNGDAVYTAVDGAIAKWTVIS